MAKIARLNVILTANSKGLTSGVRKATTSIDKLTVRARAMRTSLSRSFSGVATAGLNKLKAIGAGVGARVTSTLRNIGIAATAAGVGLAYFVKSTAETIDTAAKFSRRVGVSYTQLKAYQMAAGLAGVESEALNKSFEKMSDTLGAAFTGDTAAIEAFQSIGLSVEKLERLRPEQRFDAISSAIGRIPDPARRISAARDIFGRQGGGLLELFAGGSAAIAEATAKVQTFGLALSDIQISGIEYALDRLSDIGSVGEGVGTQLADKLAPYTSQIADDFLLWVENAGGVEVIVDGALKKLDERLKSISARFTAVKEGFEVLAGVAKLIGNLLPSTGTGSKVGEAVGRKTAAYGNQYVEDIANRRGNFKPGSGSEAPTGLYEQWRDFKDRSQGNAAMRAQDQANAPAVEAAKQQRQMEQYWSFQRNQMQAAADQQRAAEIMQGAQRRGFVPSNPAQQAGPWAEVIAHLRGIESNTGRNTVGYAG